MKRSGHADLPLHGGRVPGWLATRMATLGSAIAEYLIVDRGPREFLSRLSDPFWFQAFGAVLAWTGIRPESALPCSGRSSAA